MVSYIMSNESLREYIGENVRQMRINAQLSQQDLANKTGLARSTIAAFEAGKGGTIDTLILLLRHLQKLHTLDSFETEAPQSPISYAKNAGKTPRRVYKKKNGESPSSEFHFDPSTLKW